MDKANEKRKRERIYVGLYPLEAQYLKDKAKIVGCRTGDYLRDLVRADMDSAQIVNKIYQERLEKKKEVKEDKEDKEDKKKQF